MAEPKTKFPSQLPVAVITKTVERPPLTLWQKSAQKQVLKETKTIDDLKFDDISWRLKNRENFRNFLIRLLIGQNIAVFLLVTAALFTNKIVRLEPVFATLVGGTLLETTALIIIIVKWLFSEIPYEEKKPNL